MFTGPEWVTAQGLAPAECVEALPSVPDVQKTAWLMSQMSICCHVLLTAHGKNTHSVGSVTGAGGRPEQMAMGYRFRMLDRVSRHWLRDRRSSQPVARHPQPFRRVTGIDSPPTSLLPLLQCADLSAPIVGSQCPRVKLSLPRST